MPSRSTRGSDAAGSCDTGTGTTGGAVGLGLGVAVPPVSSGVAVAEPVGVVTALGDGLPVAVGVVVD